MSGIEIVQFLLLGGFAGLLAGLLGVGGGLIIVPVTALVLGRQGLDEGVVMHLALGTSLATIIFTSISSVRAHHVRQGVLWVLVGRFAPGIVVGALAGAALADQLPGDVLRLLFGLFVLLVALQLALAIQPPPQRGLPGTPGMAAAGTGIGGVSAVVGIGGGTLTVPFLLWCNVPMRQAVGTSAACGLPIAVAGAAGYIITGWGVPGLPAGTLGYVYLPALIAIVAASVVTAPVGAWLAHSVPVGTLKRLFALLLALIGARMLIG